MICKYENIRVRGIVATTPDHFVDNLELAERFDERVIKKQIRVTGIRKRCVALEGQRAADLCITSAKKLIKKLHWQENEISYLIFVSSYPSYRVPSTASFIQKTLGIGSQCLSFDINLACSGFVVGLQTIGGLLQGREEGTKALLLVADMTSESVTGKDKSTSILFGDCGTATAIQKQEGYPFTFLQKSDGSGYEDLIRIDGSHEFKMDGMGIFNFAISDVVDTIQEFMEAPETEKEKIQYYFIHQAQKFIVDKVRDFSGFPKERVPITYDRYGNTGCASIPLTMCENRKWFSQNRRTRVFLCAFGAGHSWGCATQDIDDETYFEICHSNEIYLDGKEEKHE